MEPVEICRNGVLVGDGFGGCGCWHMLEFDFIAGFSVSALLCLLLEFATHGLQ